MRFLKRSRTFRDPTPPPSIIEMMIAVSRTESETFDYVVRVIAESIDYDVVPSRV